MCFPSRVGSTAPQYNPHQHFLSQQNGIAGGTGESAASYSGEYVTLQGVNLMGKNGGYLMPQQQQQQWNGATLPGEGCVGVAREDAAACLVAESACSTGKFVASVGSASSSSSASTIVPGPKPKKKRKRKRKMLQPGKTATQQERHFVKHNYHDHANDAEEDYALPTAVGAVSAVGASVGPAFCAKAAAASAAIHACGAAHAHALPFPLKLHAKLEEIEEAGLASVISWQPHGRCFVVHKPKEFADIVLPRFFGLGKITSFQRQLNLYGFTRLSKGKDQGGYYHEMFLRGKAFLCRKMVRTKTKGTKFKAASSPDSEPDFYSMPPLTATKVVTAPPSPTHVHLDAHDHDGDDEREDEDMHHVGVNTTTISPNKNHNAAVIAGRSKVLSTPPPPPLHHAAPSQEVVSPSPISAPKIITATPPTSNFAPQLSFVHGGVGGGFPIPSSTRGPSPTHVSDDDSEHFMMQQQRKSSKVARRYDPSLRLEGMDPFEPIPVDPERVGQVAETAESVLAQEFADCDWSYLFCDGTNNNKKEDVDVNKADRTTSETRTVESWTRHVSTTTTTSAAAAGGHPLLSQALSFDGDMDPLDAFVKQTMKIEDDECLDNYLNLLVE